MNDQTAQTVLSAPAQQKSQSPLVGQFLEYLKLERHFSDYTVKSYGADLFQFGQYLSGEIGHAHLPRSPTPMSGEELDHKQVACEPLTIREFLAYLCGNNYTE